MWLQYDWGQRPVIELRVGRENSMGRRGFESGRGRTPVWITSATSAGDIETIAPLSGGGIG
jgi:hypothetical protein